MIEIEVVKSPEGKDVNRKFSNRYLLATDLTYRELAVKEKGIQIAAAERLLYFAHTEFMAIIVRGLTNRGVHIEGASKSFALDFNGAMVFPAGGKMAPPNVCAGISKETYNGAAAITPYRHCVTVDEYEAFMRTGDLPVRFRDPNGIADAATVNFIEALHNAIGVGAIRHCLPFRRITPTNQPRLVQTYTPAGIVLNQPTRQKRSGIKNARAAAQQRINELASRARYAQRVDHNGVIPDGADALVRALRAQAVTIYQQLPPDEQSRIVWPAVFDRNPLSGGL